MFEEYIASYGKRLFGLCQKLCDQLEDAEDLYQETWVKAYRNINKHDNDKEFMGWLTAICINTYRDMLRRQKWKSFLLLFRTNEEKEFVLSNVPVQEEPDYSDIRDAIYGLPDKYRMVTILYYFDDFDIEKTSKILKIPAGTVKYRLYRARNILKRRLENDG